MLADSDRCTWIVLWRQKWAACQASWKERTQIQVETAPSSVWSLTLISAKLHTLSDSALAASCYSTYWNWTKNILDDIKMKVFFFLFKVVSVEQGFIFFFLMSCVIANTKSKSWTEQRFFFCCFYTWRCTVIVVLIFFVCICNWKYVISKPVWCSQENQGISIACVCECV